VLDPAQLRAGSHQVGGATSDHGIGVGDFPERLRAIARDDNGDAWRRGLQPGLSPGIGADDHDLAGRFPAGPVSERSRRLFQAEFRDQAGGIGICRLSPGLRSVENQQARGHQRQQNSHYEFHAVKDTPTFRAR